MKFEDAMRKIARRAERASRLGMDKLKAGRIKHEDDLTPALAMAIESAVNGYKAGGVTWDASVLTHRRSGELFVARSATAPSRAPTLPILRAIASL